MVGDRISFGGIASGLDTNAIIDSLMAIQRRPIEAAQFRMFQQDEKRQALQQVGTAFSSLLGSLDSLRKPATFTTQSTSVLAQTVDVGKVQATANGSAPLGSFDVDVLQIATSTRARSAAAAGNAINSAVSLDTAGFVDPFAAGTFTINSTEFTIPEATATNIVSSASIGAAADPAVALNAAGFDIVPTTGDFQINGVTIAFDDTLDTLNDVVTRINQSAAGVTASFDDATKQLTLTSDTNGPALITLVDTTGNFLESVNLLDGLGAKIGTETAGTDLISLDDVINMINLSGAGVIASIQNDADARPNILRIEDDPFDGAQSVYLGAGGDTSNFLAVTHLLESPGTTTRDGVRGMGGTQVTETLVDANLANVLIAVGTFEINGVEFDYDTGTDSMSGLITKINQSSAGVTAFYDPFADKVVLSQDASGSTAIQLNDVAGDFLAQVGLLAAVQETGANAEYQIDGGAVQYSNSNTVTSAVVGVTLTLTGVTTTSVNVEVRHDSASASAAAAGFVEKYNETQTLIDRMTAFVEDGDNGLLLGDGTLRRAKSSMQSILTGAAFGVPGDLRTLSDVGISFGVVGSAIGTTQTLVLDEAKLQAALLDNADGVAQLFSTFAASAALDAGGTGSLASLTGTPTAATKAGTYSITSTASGGLTVVFQPDDGSTAVTQTGSIAASGTNTTIIPGVTLTAAGVLVAGTDTITIAATERGIGLAMHDYVDTLTRTGGTFDIRDEEYDARIDIIEEQIERLEKRAEARELFLSRQFTALEQTIGRLQQQGQALTGMVAQMNANQPK
ncbi:MAG: flagellar filament capping protein FliD [Dehalococcoidia bacterium]|jgi:flagellar hook-associated protein 2|nr:flagellar filament capping protein FliD [Dehalococcoidia bacterium]